MDSQYENIRQRELDNCAFIKTVLMMVIVLYHSILFWRGVWFTKDPIYEAPLLEVLAQWMKTFHIYGFTLVSGYLFYYLKHEKGKYTAFMPFVKTKAKRLLVPYIAVTVLWAFPFNLLRGQVDWKAVLMDYALGITADQLWFLLMLFNVFVMFWVLSKRIQKHDLQAVVIAVILYGIGIVGSKFVPNVFQIWRSCKQFTFFLVGYKIRQYGSKLLMKIPALIWMALSISLFALEQSIPAGSALINLLKTGLLFVCNLVGAVMTFVVLQKIAQRVPYQKNRLTMQLTKLSMPIYLLHQQLVYVFIYLLNGVINPYIHATVNFLGALSLSALVAAVLMKFNATRFLLGEKTKNISTIVK